MLVLAKYVNKQCVRFSLSFLFLQIDKTMVHRNGMAGRVNKEVNYHSKLNHTSIIKLYTYFEDANYVYLVLELAENGELKNFLKKNERVSAK